MIAVKGVVILSDVNASIHRVLIVTTSFNLLRHKWDPWYQEDRNHTGCPVTTDWGANVEFEQNNCVMILYDLNRGFITVIMGINKITRSKWNFVADLPSNNFIASQHFWACQKMYLIIFNLTFDFVPCCFQNCAKPENFHFLILTKNEVEDTNILISAKKNIARVVGTIDWSLERVCTLNYISCAWKLMMQIHVDRASRHHIRTSKMMKNILLRLCLHQLQQTNNFYF